MLSRSLARVLQKLLGAVVVLLVVPIAVNVGTGGTPPRWLAPVTPWLWPVALACVVVIVALELAEQQGPVRAAIAARRPDDPHNVDRALDQVARYVDLRKRNSLAEKVRITLALDERPDAVRQSVHLVRRIGGSGFGVRAAGDIAAVFEELSGSMLLLGAAGAGKSTQLLDLAERLIADGRAERARNPAAEPLVPVLVDLGDWLRSGLRRRPWGLRRAPRLQAFARWLGAVLRQRYGIPALVSASWLADNRLVLLLDGLDEVPAGARDQCVTAINDLQASVSRVVVCSRTDDYAELHVALRLQGAVEIRPFRPQQVIALLGAVSPQLRGVANALAADEELREMVTTPLMLNIMAVAYSEGSAPALPIDGDPETRRRLLFDAYVVEVLARHRARPARTGTEQTLRALRALARITASADSGVRVPSPTDPRTMERGLDATHQRVVAGWLTIGAGCAGAIAATAFVAPRTGLVPALLVGGWLWVRAALHVDAAALVAPPGRTTPARYVLLLGWSALVGTVLYALARALIAILGELLPSSWAASEQPEWAGICGLIACASWATVAVSTMVDELRPTTPVARPLVVHLVVTAAAIVVCGMLLSRPVPVSAVTAVAAFAGVIFGYPIGRAASSVVIGPLSRLTLVLAGEPDPWRPELLRFAADRSLLSFVDIEYRFVHLLVRDHLAECDPPSLAGAVATRRGQLPQRT